MSWSNHVKSQHQDLTSSLQSAIHLGDPGCSAKNHGMIGLVTFLQSRTRSLGFDPSTYGDFSSSSCGYPMVPQVRWMVFVREMPAINGWWRGVPPFQETSIWEIHWKIMIHIIPINEYRSIPFQSISYQYGKLLKISKCTYESLNNKIVFISSKLYS